MNLKCVLAATILLHACVTVTAEEKSDFEEKLRGVLNSNHEFFDKMDADATNDRLLQANAELLKKADAEKSALLDFVIANKLYAMDPKASFDLHKRALAALPNEPYVNLEWAMECHRRGDIQSAIPAYEAFLKGYNDHAYYALLADCNIRAGKPDEAIAAWKKAGHPNHHVSIDFAIYEIYGDLSPQRKRADLLAKVEAGDQGAIEPLVLQDLNMSQDWWNAFVDEEGLKRDLKRAETALGKDSPRYRQLQAIAELLLAEHQKSKADDEKTAKPDGPDLLKTLTTLKLLLKDGALPENPVVTTHFIRLALQQKLVSSKELVERFGAELEKRATTGAGNAEELNTLSYLYSDLENWDRVAALDKIGWDKFHDIRFVTSTIAGLARNYTLKVDSPELKRALEDFPEHQLLWSFRLMLLGKNCTEEDFVGAIKAEYRHPSEQMGMINSYTLKAYFAELAKRRAANVRK